MKRFAFLLVLAACASNRGPQAPIIDDTGTVSTITFRLDQTDEAASALYSHCGAKGPYLPQILREEPAGKLQRGTFECRNPGQFGDVMRTSARRWSQSGEPGAFISCDHKLADCYERALYLCGENYQVAEQTMRGAVPAPVSNMSISGGATAINAFGDTSFAQNVALGVSIAEAKARREAAAAHAMAVREAQAEAAKEYGKIWVTCGS